MIFELIQSPLTEVQLALGYLKGKEHLPYPDYRKMNGDFVLSELLLQCGLNPHLHFDQDFNLISEEFNACLSHVDEKSFACVVSRTFSERPGLDVELLERKISDEEASFFLNDKDELEDYLSLWCVKEAAYKCHSFLYQKQMGKKLLMKEIIVKKNATVEIFQATYRFQIVKQNNHLIALVY